MKNLFFLQHLTIFEQIKKNAAEGVPLQRSFEHRCHEQAIIWHIPGIEE